MSVYSRRSFIIKSTVITAAANFTGILQQADAAPIDTIGKEAVILFQGDSITDGNRTRDNDWNHVMGHGYAYLISSRLWYDHPEKKFHFLNRGISGHKVTDLAARWQTDTLDLKPDVLSIMVGINDVLACFNGNKSFSAENFENDYRGLLAGTLTALPNIKLVICAPFVMQGTRTNAEYSKWTAEVAKRSAVAKKLAGEFNAVFVDFQKPFNDALAKAPVEYWVWDGVHPMPAGHELMARHWLKLVNKQIKLL
ncbi:lysophospholipase [Mucilaginibacter sp. PAMC 26640]|nr:lysophospholipase [Mucilaginibacter sp. PAMC 26640]